MNISNERERGVKLKEYIKRRKAKGGGLL